MKVIKETFKEYFHPLLVVGRFVGNYWFPLLVVSGLIYSLYLALTHK